MVVAATRPTRIKISQVAVTHNVAVTRQASGAKFMFLAVKANAYGFGLIPMAQAAVKAGVDGLAVAVLDEALALRQAGITVPILILGITLPQYAKLIADNNLIATVSDLAWLQLAQENLDEHQATLQVNLGVDTGMGRIGFRSRETLSEAITYLQSHASFFKYQSIMTHFSESDSLATDYFQKQLANWHRLTDDLPMPPMVHLANSGAAMYHADELPTDYIRAGTVVYGIEPSRGEVLPDNYLKPVLTLETELVFVKKMPADVGISYGHTYYTYEGEWVGTLPIGYADGLPRPIQGFEVLVNGKKAPIIGQIAMDQMMISLPEELPVGTVVTIIGKQGQYENTIEDVAQHVGLAPWVVATGLQDRLMRVLVD
ncbi:alanine racemase [Weissella fangxianensis]|uniref:alanine racemase n=1 Tax=Weissella fangxianensis TaxID=2953879 RepID=UPI00215764A3|nr:alanine racemase [Weissella fangxianensis]